MCLKNSYIRTLSGFLKMHIYDVNEDPYQTCEIHGPSVKGSMRD